MIMNDLNSNEVTHLVVDMLYDFIDGSLACYNAENAVVESVKYINSNPLQQVLYTCDSHPYNHCSFKSEGGIWPSHAVANTRGGTIHQDYFKKISEPNNRPNLKNIFTKGTTSTLEEYTGFYSRDVNGAPLSESILKKVVVSGIATEFCIKESVLDLLKSGREVYLIKNALGWVNQNDHNSVLEELSNLGITII